MIELKFQPDEGFSHVLYQLDEQEAIEQLYQKSGGSRAEAETAFQLSAAALTLNIQFATPKALKIQLLIQRLTAEFPAIVWQKLTVDKETAATYQLVFIPAKAVRWVADNSALTPEQSLTHLAEEIPLPLFTEQVQKQLEAALFVPLLKEERLVASTNDPFARLQRALDKVEQRKKQLDEQSSQQTESLAHLSDLLPASSRKETREQAVGNLHRALQQVAVQKQPAEPVEVPMAPRPKKPIQKKRRLSKKWIAGIALIFIGLLAFILCANFSLARVEGNSMVPTLTDGDWILMYKNSDLLERGDIISFNSPDKSGETYLKRVVGLPGDTIDIIDDELYIDDKKVDLAGSVQDYSLEDTTGKRQVPKGKVFVLGDNLNHSRDSREFGFVDLSDITGKLLWHS
ncbi:signal peptidase I [Listeria costaricensis]|uniref:signal peptidase I n=1 Tax=Listeria costaricensis TaxID=2026604 RepID=UPI000C070E72|nr:signal peptidase I [Listeria costaricensis]